MVKVGSCPKCGAPQGLIGWLCNCWLSENDSIVRPKIDKNCEHAFSFEEADVDLLLRLIKNNYKEYQNFYLPCDECGGKFNIKFKTIRTHSPKE